MHQWESDAEVFEPQEMQEYMLKMARREMEMYNK
jgi:predicted DNA-binding transcriptional regulator YafY